MIKQEPDKNLIDKVILLFNEKKYLEALDLSNNIIGEYPNSILINNILGVIHTELKNYTLARDLFIKVVNLNPKYNDGFYNLANIYNKLGEEDNAIKNYEKVIELDKSYYKAYNNLGNIFRKRNLNKKALEYYILTLNINPNYIRGFYNLAGVLQHFILDEKNKYINKFFLYLLEKKIIVLKDGLIVEENYSRNIFNSPKSEYTKKLISSVI